MRLRLQWFSEQILSISFLLFNTDFEAVLWPVSTPSRSIHLNYSFYIPLFRSLSCMASRTLTQTHTHTHTHTCTKMPACFHTLYHIRISFSDTRTHEHACFHTLCRFILCVVKKRRWGIGRKCPFFFFCQTPTTFSKICSSSI